MLDRAAHCVHVNQQVVDLADHPLIDDLKRRSFTIVSPVTQREVTASGFLDTCETRAAHARPFMQFLCRALGVEY